MAEGGVFTRILNFISHQVNHLVSPDVPNDAYQKSTRLAVKRPITFSLIVLGLAVILSPIITAVTISLVATVSFWSFLVCLAIIALSPALVPLATIAATIWLSYATLRWSANLFAKVPVGSGNESNQVLMKPEAEANGNEAHAKLELNLFKIEEKGSERRT